MLNPNSLDGQKTANFRWFSEVLQAKKSIPYQGGAGYMAAHG
jgi:hypothetical protein